MDLASLTLRELTAGFNHGTDTAPGHNDGKGIATPPEGTLRRCRTREQGMALITISHAIEYLLNSSVSQQAETSNAEREALALLLTANLSVYKEGSEVVPLLNRLRQWFHGGSSKNDVADLAA